MLLKIGKRESGGDLVDLLLECHARIRHFLALAYALSSREDASEQQVREGCTEVERYFTLALPLHVLDEDESLAPRLRGQSDSLDEALTRMVDEHDQHATLLAALLESCARLRGEPGDGSTRHALGLATERLTSALESHLQHEEQAIFPALRALPKAVRDEIAHELRERRSG